MRTGKKPELIVKETRAVRSWIHARVDAGWTDEEIARVLPVATAFILGQITEADLRARMGMS